MILRSIALALLVLLAPVMGAVPTKTVILSQGERVPGDQTWSTWGTFLDTCVDAEGGLVARVAATRGECIIYKSFGGPVVVRAKVGQQVKDPANPDLPLRIASFLQGYRPVRAVLPGKFVFVAQLNSGGTQSGWNAIILSDATGLHLVARLGLPAAPGGAPIIAFGNWMRFTRDGNVLFSALGGNDVWSVFEWSPGGVVTHLPSADFSPSRFPFYGLVSNESVVLVGHFAWPHEAWPKPGIARLTPDGATLIARDGDPVPGRGDEEFAFFPDLLSCNDAGDVLFHANSRSPSVPNAGRLWLGRANGAIDLVATTSYPTTAAVNIKGDVAYLAQGLYVKRGGQPVQDVIRETDVRPELRELKDRLCMDRNGNVVFQSASGIWIYTPTRFTLPIAQLGETIIHKGTQYRIVDIGLIESVSGGEDGRPRFINDWGQIAFVARLARGGTLVSALIVATLPNGGIPKIKPVAHSDEITFASGLGSTVKINVLANDVNPALDPASIQIVTDGTFGKASVRDGIVYYTPSDRFLAEDSFQYVLSNRWGLSQTATVVARNPYFSSGGSYGTEVFAGSKQVGTALLTLTTGGKMSGRIQFSNQLLRLSGTFSDEGFHQTFILRNGESVTVRLLQQLDPEQPAEQPARISGWIESSSGTTYEIRSTVRFGLPANAKAMKVTGQIRTEGDVSLPKGIGFLAGTLASSGSFVARGRLPDNQPFAASSRMKTDGSLAFDCAPYGKGRGRLSGSFHKTGTGPAFNRWDATLQWTRNSAVGGMYPDGIDGQVTALLAPYAPNKGMPAISNHGEIATGAITLDVPGELQATETLSWSNRDLVVFTPPNPRRAQLRVNRANGLVSGNYTNFSQELRRFSGVIFSLGNGAVGLVSGGESTGSFILYAN